MQISWYKGILRRNRKDCKNESKKLRNGILEKKWLNLHQKHMYQNYGDQFDNSCGISL